MKGTIKMTNALIISESEKGVAFFSKMLKSVPIHDIVIKRSCSEARRLLLERQFDLVIINAPLKDEVGDSLAMQIAMKSVSQVIITVDASVYEDISASLEDYGVLTVAKPINTNLFWSVLKIAIATSNKLNTYKNENQRLTKQISDIKTVDRAKRILMNNFSLSENDAHKHIEKEAMNQRKSKVDIALSILKTYEN